MVYDSGDQSILELGLRRHSSLHFHGVASLRRRRFTPENGVGFTASCLAVGHDYPVESIQYIENNWLGDLLVALALC